MTGAAGLQRAGTAYYDGAGAVAGAVKGLTRAGPRSRLEGVGRADSLCGYSRVTAITWAVNDDIGFLLPRAVGVEGAGSQVVLGSRTMQVAGALSWAVARTEHPSVIRVRVELSIGA